MDKAIIHLSNSLENQLQQKHAAFQEISKGKFRQLQADFERRQSLIYRTTDIELADGNSEVTFYSLVYLKKNFRTRYFASETSFVVPPSQFLGDREENEIIQWLRKDKAAFFKQQRSSGESSASNRSLHLCRTLTPYEKQEVEECSRIFAQWDKDEVFDEDMSDDVELPSFNVGLDFLWL